MQSGGAKLQSTIGDALRPVEAEDIKRANNLMYLTADLCEIVCMLILIFVFAVT